MAMLRHDFHCLLVDLPGHGNSRDIEWTNFDDVAEIVADAIKDRTRGKPHLVGFALGGYLILKLLEKHADLVDKVIVDGASHRPITGSRKGIAVAHLLPLLKNTRIVAQLLTMIMRKMVYRSRTAESLLRTYNEPEGSRFSAPCRRLPRSRWMQSSKILPSLFRGSMRLRLFMIPTEY